MLAPGKTYIGRPVRIPVNFQVDDVDVDPDEVTLKTRSPCGTETSYVYSDAEVTRSSAGDYYVDVTPNEAGRWWYRWESTGTGTTDAFEGDFIVQASPFSAFNSAWWTGDYWYW
jgi:hypothetical protein